MITTVKDSEGRVIAFCEWRLVGRDGLESSNGRYVWVNDCWVHEAFRNMSLVSRIIDDVMTAVPRAEYCYFQRKDVNDKLHLYSRRQWERRRNAYLQKIKET